MDQASSLSVEDDKSRSNWEKDLNLVLREDKAISIKNKIKNHLKKIEETIGRRKQQMTFATL